MKKWFGGPSGDRREKDGIEDDFGADKDYSERQTPPEAASSAKKNAVDSMEIDDVALKPKKVILVKNKFPKQKKKWSVRKKTIIFSCLGVVGALVIAGAVWAITLISNPLAQFNPGSTQPQATQTQPGTQTSEPSGEVTPTPTLDPEQLLLSQADMTILQDKFINILLIGVDHAEERDTWGGKKDFHADVMIVLCINKETGKVSMISLPRDTYADIPGVDGIYKLNASLDCGGGWPTEPGDTAGFEKVCEAAEWMLGGIPVDYYFAVDMGAVKGLVNQIGGVDYDLDISFDNQGRNYTMGLQHMDGQAVLDYMRVRKAEHIVQKDQATDANRVNRQKKMLFAIFNKIKSNGLLAGIPDMITAFDGNLYYNMTFGQISGLALYALQSVNTDDIEMYSMSGSSRNIFNWNFIITNQANRLTIISEVYGIPESDIPKHSSYALPEAQLLWGQMQAPHYAQVALPILDQVKAILDADALKPVEPTPTPSPSPTATPSESTAPTESVEPTPTVTPTPALTPPPGGWRQYGDDVWAFYYQVRAEYDALVNYETYESGEELLALEKLFKETDIPALCGMFNIAVPTAKEWRLNYESDPLVNEVDVDFN